MSQDNSQTTSRVFDFNAVANLPVNNKPDGYSSLLEKIITQSHGDALENDLSAYAAFLILGSGSISGVAPSEPLSIIAARPLLTDFCTKLGSLQNAADLQINVAATSIRILAPRVVSFVEQDYSLKLLLADAHQANEDFSQSARALETISLDGQNVSDAKRVEIWIRIARCYLEDDDSTSAGLFINRAKNIIHNIPANTTRGRQSRIQFQTAQARVLDSQRQFLDAAASYHTLSFEPLIDEDDRFQTLTAAIICAVLAPAGPQRARMLAKLYKDERASQLPEHPILEKIYLDRVLDPAEVTAFAAKLAPHHLAKTADGNTVLERAVLEHNLLGASRLYHNISVDGLASLLGTDSDRAEQYAASMIEQGRLRGSIDQIEGVIFFAGEIDVSGGNAMDGVAGVQATASGAAGRMSELRVWDVAIQGLLAEVENVTTMIQVKDPGFYAKVMDG